MYDVIVKLENGKSYELSSYEMFKEYIKKHTKKLFGKKDMALHMKAISEFVSYYKDVMSEEDTFDVFVGGKTRGVREVFIS